MTYERSAGGVVYTVENGELKYLIIRSCEGIYGFPKGHLEAGEDEIAAAKREIWEETGIKAELLTDFCVTTEHPLPKKPGVMKHVTYFAANYENQTPKHQESELSSVSLMSYTEAYAAIQFADTREVLQKANKFIIEHLAKINDFAITFLGTCAHDYSPRLETDLKNRFDKNARRSSVTLMNGSSLIDGGDHLLECLRILGKPTEEIDNIFISHTHCDHYNRDYIAQIAASKKVPLHLWVREDAVIEDIPNIIVHKMLPCVKYCVNEALFVTGMPANHNQKFYPQHFIFESGGKKLFYGCDGACFLHSTFILMKNSELDMMILDATVGDYEGDFRMGEHNSIPMIRLMLPSLRTTHIINDNTRLYLSHLAHSLHKPHDETVEIAKGFGANVAFDGLTVTF